jgi:ActR/RegA family two-component response regulator
VKTVLIIDPDLGFVFWLGQALSAAGYEAFPAKDISEAIALLAELHVQVDLLILNPSLAGAANLVAALRQSRADLKLLLLAGAGDQQIPSPDAILPKPAQADDLASSVWLRCVERLFSRNMVGSGGGSGK